MSDTTKKKVQTMTNAEKFKDIFGIYATELRAMSEKDFLEWLHAAMQEEAEDGTRSNTAITDWTPYSSAPPEEDGTYLTTLIDGRCTYVDTNTYDSSLGSGKEFWLFGDNVTAWMPLPKPYKGE